MLWFTAEGVPVPKGSLRHVGNGRLVEQTKVKPWMSRIRKAALEAGQRQGVSRIDVPVAVTVTFTFTRPKSAQNRLYPHMRSVGDIDKLCRAVLDALQVSKTEEGVMDDDSLVVTLIASKVYGDEPGVTVEVTELI
jgi:crossover junction endodeoxyribonuclease RusA